MHVLPREAKFTTSNDKLTHFEERDKRTAFDGYTIRLIRQSSPRIKTMLCQHGFCFLVGSLVVKLVGQSQRENASDTNLPTTHLKIIFWFSCVDFIQIMGLLL